MGNLQSIISLIEILKFKEINVFKNSVCFINYFKASYNLIYLIVLLILLIEIINIISKIRLKKKNKGLLNSKKIMVSSINHKVINLTNGIFGMIQLIQMTELDDVQKKYFDHMYFSMKALILTFSNITFLAKHEIDALPMLKVRFDIAKIALFELNSFDLQAKNKGIELIFDIDNKIPEFIMGNKEILRLLLSNILDNAIKFTSYGKVSLFLKNVYEDDDKLIVKFKIIDTGKGFSEEDVNKFFTGYFLQKTKQSGIGLLTSRKIIESIGGTIWWKSELNFGSVFYFQIPFDKEKNKLPSY